MRWRIQIDPKTPPIDIQLVEIKNDAYTFQIGKERITLHSPKIFPYSLATDELSLTFEAWSKDKWRAVQGAKTFTVQSLSYESSSAGAQNEIRTQMPGRILKVFVKPGDTIKAQQTLLIVEAMKMENEIRATADAVVKEISVQPGQSVESGSILIKLE
jgi:biotin carboxyl carrier protein